MKGFIVPLLTAVIVVSIIFAGCVPGAPEAPPVTPPPVTPPPAPTKLPPIQTRAEGQAAGFVDPRMRVPSESDFEPAGIFTGLCIKPDGTQVNAAVEMLSFEFEWVKACGELMASYITRGGGNCTLLAAGGNLEKQVRDVEDLQARGNLDFLILNPVDVAGLAPVVDKLWAAGIPTVCMGEDAQTDNLVSVSWVNQYGLGRVAGEELRRVIDDQGKPVTVYELFGFLGISSTIERDKGFKDAVAGDPLITVIEGPECQYSSAKATGAIVDVFGAHPEWTAVYEMGSMTGGVIQGLKQIDRCHPIGDPRHVIVQGTDDTPLSVEGLLNKYVDSLIGHTPWYEGDATAKSALLYYCCGKPVKRYYVVPIYICTPENADAKWLWANVLARGDKMSDLPVLNMSDVIPTPYKGMP